MRTACPTAVVGSSSTNLQQWLPYLELVRAKKGRRRPQGTSPSFARLLHPHAPEEVRALASGRVHWIDHISAAIVAQAFSDVFRPDTQFAPRAGWCAAQTTEYTSKVSDVTKTAYYVVWYLVLLFRVVMDYSKAVQYPVTEWIF